MAGLHYKLLILLVTGVSFSSGYPHVALTASPQYVIRGNDVKFDCVFRPNGLKPSYTRMVITLQGRIVKEVGNDKIKWESTGGILYTELTHTTAIYQDETYNCTAYFGEPPRQSVSAVHRVMVCCPLRIESRKLIIDTNNDIYGLDITVSGNDVGEGNITSSNLDSPIKIDVKSSVTSGRFQLGQTQAKLFSVRWKMRQDWERSCADQGEGSNDYTLMVHGQVVSESFIEEPFKTLYPAQWNRITAQVHTIAAGDRYNRTIRCDICANPLPTITWYLCGDSPPPDVIISQSGAELTIPEVQDRHVGIYVCTATNNINNQKLTKKFEVKLSINGSDAEPDCIRNARVKTFVIPTIIVLVVAVIVVIICWKCKQIQECCQGLKEHVTSERPKDRWIEKDKHVTGAQDKQPPDVLPDQSPPDKPPREPTEQVEGVKYAVLDELKPCPERTPTLPRGDDDDDRVEYATVVTSNN